MKKINAGLSLVTDVFLALHMWIMTFSLFTGWYNLALCKTSAHLLAMFFCAHAVLTLCIFFFCHEGTAISCKKENISTIMQRVEALLMILLIHSHVQAYGFMATGARVTAAKAVFTCITETLFILCVCSHSALSTPKAFISLGLIRSEKAHRTAECIFGAIYGVSGLAAITAVIRFFAVM